MSFQRADRPRSGVASSTRSRPTYISSFKLLGQRVSCPFFISGNNLAGRRLSPKLHYRSALATIINAHHALPLAAAWGAGTTSSSVSISAPAGAVAGTAASMRNTAPIPACCSTRTYRTSTARTAAEWHVARGRSRRHRGSSASPHQRAREKKPRSHAVVPLPDLSQ